MQKLTPRVRFPGSEVHPPPRATIHRHQPCRDLPDLSGKQGSGIVERHHVTIVEKEPLRGAELVQTTRIDDGLGVA
ncbi:MAG: hypothetical protein ACXIUW_04505 [Roseinatronobacter sp.]